MQGAVMKKILCAAIFTLMAANVFAINYSAKVYQQTVIEDLRRLLIIPNTLENPDGLNKTVQEVIALLKKSDISAQLLKPKNLNSPPIIFGEWKVPGAKKTLLFYAHYDGVIVQPDNWTVTQPFHPMLLSDAVELGGKPVVSSDTFNSNWRLYGRSAADDKEGIIAILAAIQTFKTNHTYPGVNIKLLFEGEEELGSIHLDQILKENKELVKSDGWILIDGSVHPSGGKTVIFGARGDASLRITVYGSKIPLHSGEYGGWAPNPVMRLAKLLSSMQDEKGRVTIEGFYDDVKPLKQAEKNTLAEIPNVYGVLQSKLGFSYPENANLTLDEIHTQPSLIIIGFNSGTTGKASIKQIPASAAVSIDLRLVQGNDGKKQIERLIQHMKKQNYTVLDHDPSDAERARYPFIAKIVQDTGYNADKLAMDSPLAKQIIEAVQSTTNQQIVKIPIMGASTPVLTIRKITGAPCVSLPISNYDSNPHAENENLRLGNLFDGIDSIVAIMQQHY